MKSRILCAALTLGFGLLPGWTEPGVAILTNSRKPAVNGKAEQVKKFLTSLREQNHLDETQFSILTVDMSNPAQEAIWHKQFEVTADDLPALAFVTRKGNKISDLGTMIRKFSDPTMAASSLFKYAQTQKLAITVTDVVTGFNIQSVPDGATVYLDGVEAGQTPLAGVTAPAGKPCKVELKHPDADQWSASYTLKPGEVQNVQVTLRQYDGMVRFEAPVVAQVFLDGSATPSGKTPFDVKGLRSGGHSAILKAPGYFDSSFPFRVSGNRLTVLSCKMNPAKLKVAYEIKTEGFTSPDLTIALDSNQLASELSQCLNGLGAFIPVAGGSDWDVAIRADLHCSRLSMSGAFILMDRNQATLSSESGEKGVPLFSFNYSGDATANAKKMFQELVPKLVSGLSVEKLGRNAETPPEVKVVDIPKE